MLIASRSLLPTASPFSPFTNVEAARELYHGTLGLQLHHDDAFALVFSCRALLRIVRTPDFYRAPYTIHGCKVDDLES